MKQIIVLVFIGCIIFSATGQVLRIDKVDPEEISIKGFTLTSTSEVTINGSGGVFRDEYRLLLFYGWILDSKTRKVVWHLFDEFRGRDFRNEDGICDFKASVDLPPGDYELYFTGAYGNQTWNEGIWSLESFGEMIEELFDSRNKMKYQWSLQDDLFISVAGSTLIETDTELLLDKQLNNAAVFYIKARNDERFKDGFTITDETKVRIYALGEGRSDELFDYLWIHEVSAGKRVFEMNYRNTSSAGGARKNIKIDEVITLPAGSYLINYVTDASHSYEGWNALPPDDPQFWGVTVYPATASDKGNFVDFDPPETINPVIQIKGIEDSELATAGFKLKKDLDVRVLCLGEESNGEGMADYGWIVDARTRNTVWKMHKYRSEYAGGAKKNRRAEEVINLPAGEYIAYFVTDDSHSLSRWNAASPIEEELWGLTIYATAESDLPYIEPFNPNDYKPVDVLTEIVMVSDNRYYKEYFTLAEPTGVLITAMGEGRNGRMYDFGWIKNIDTGRLVWEMEYGRTESAGGSEKNRIIREKLKLPAGEYRVYFETDGSHSFNNWNASPPSDPQSYGIRIVKADQ